MDSPSRQLLLEFGRMLLNDDRAFAKSLDERTAEQTKLHEAALNRAMAKHAEVREGAEREFERIELENERERRRRDLEQKKAIEKARADLEEQKIAEQRRQVEAAKSQEEARRRQELLKRQQEDVKREQEQGMRDAEARRQREAEEVKRQEEVRKQQASDARGRSTQGNVANGDLAQESSALKDITPSSSQNGALGNIPPNALTNGTSTSQPPSSSAPADQSLAVQQGIVTSTSERARVHEQYLTLPRRLKQMRRDVSEQAKDIAGLKNQLSDWRRAIQKCCGQLGKGGTDEVKAQNKRAMLEILKHLDAAAKVAEPSIDVTQYLVQNQQPSGANKQGPAVLVFLLNHFAKKIVSQFISESAVDPRSADPIGVLAVTVFARPQYLFNGQSLIDLLWAKYHKVCPTLFGITGSERTKQGRAKLGWQVEGDTFVSDQQHYDRMSGLGVGFAALTLRDFSKSKNANPAPNRIYWESIARLLNTSAQEVQLTHFVILKAMIEQYVHRITGTFGGAGKAILRQALIHFPNERGPADEKGRKLPAVTALQAMPMILQRDLHLTL